MKTVFALTLLAVTISITPARAAASATQATEIYMPDGQHQSHMVRVYVNKSIGNIPLTDISLKLYTTHSLLSQNPEESKIIHPDAIDNSHAWMKPVKGTDIQQYGTLLLFDLKSYPIPNFKTATRVIPELDWCSKESDNNVSDCRAIGAKEIYLANSTGAYLWAAGSMIALILLIGFMSVKAHGGAIYLLCDSQGKLSLSRTQMALWTIAIGGIVEAFGLTRFEVPEIPNTLLALMGASLLTTGVSYAKSEQPSAGEKETPNWYDLISDGNTNTLSLARAQMLFWTIISLGIFVSKSILDDALWQVPVELVGLMGMSQLAYLAPKMKKDTAVSGS